MPVQCSNEITITIINIRLKFRGWAGSPFYTVTWAEAYLHAKYHLDPSSHLATINTGQTFGGLRPPFWAGERGPHLTQSGKGRGLPAC